MITIFEKLDRFFRHNWQLAVLDLHKGRWLITPKPRVIPYLKAQNALGRHILIQPIYPDSFLLADDISPLLLKNHHQFPNGSFKPARLIIETSPNNFQVWIHFNKPLTLNQKHFLLHKLKSDPAAHPHNRFGRCPGFRNRKLKYQNPNGGFPLAKLIWVDWQNRADIPLNFFPQSSPLPKNLPPKPPRGGVCQPLCRNQYLKDNESQTDFAYALALLRAGFNDQDIKSRLLTERSDWLNHRGEKKQMLYLDRTIRRARQIAQLSP